MAPQDRTFESMQDLRTQLIRSGLAVDPGTLPENTPFYVIEFTVSNGVALRHSGVFLRRETAGRTMYFTVALDGDAEPQRLSGNQLGFFPPGTAMVVTITRFGELRYRLGVGFIDTDLRSEAAQEAEIKRRPCPCGIVCGDGEKCPEWPDCVIP